MVDFTKVNSEVDKTVKIFVDRFKKELQEIFSTKVSEALRAEFLKVYDKLASIEEGQFGGEIKGADPTSLAANRGLFARQLDQELARISFADDEIIINVMNKDDLGFGRSPGDAPEGSPSTVDWLGYYIEGMAGPFAFITPKQYKARGRRSSKPLGRFGAGFLMPLDRYQAELWEEVTGVSFNAVRHPISGQPPFKGFEEIPKSFDFGPFIEEALAKATTATQAAT